MRKKRFLYNTISSLLFQISTIICGFILPKYFLFYYGSEVNGLITSITQFLSVISFLELGVGAVVQSALYLPLAKKDTTSVSRILKSADRFFKQLALILLVYVTVLIIVYPLLIDKQFGWFFTAILIFAISISSFARYYFGVVDRLLLTADQKGYIQYTAQTVTLILNTIACVIAIRKGMSIEFVKTITSLIYLTRPLFLRLYTNHHYSIDRSIEYEEEPIKQKWNGVAQHFSAVVLDCADTIVLTLFSTLTNVSVYSIYYMVVSGVKQVFLSLMNGVQSLFGELWAKNEIEQLRKVFASVEWAVHVLVIIVFGCTSTLIAPFVRVYTSGVNDINYIYPTFGLLLSIAHGFHCLRLPYNIMILAGNHYKQTQSNYIIAAVINLVTSIVAVKRFGLIGVAIGTLVAMVYQTVWMANYISKNLIEWPFASFIKRIIVDVISFVPCFVICSLFHISTISYLSWFVLAIKEFLIWSLIVLIINSFFYPGLFKIMLERIKKTRRFADEK